jgi:hypothetical protein
MSFSIAAQNLQELDEANDYLKEWVWGINKNSNGGLIGGVFVKYAQKKGDRQYQTFAVYLMNLKNPREVRYPSVFTGNTYIYGKTNYLYGIRLQYGREYLLFKKAAQRGVQVNATVSAGPSIGILAPYYLEYAFGPNNVVGQYDPNIHVSRNNILGTGRIFQGIGDSELRVGANAKAGLIFEFGTFKKGVTGIEIGISGDIYSGEVELVPFVENDNLFTSIYINFFLGTRN